MTIQPRGKAASFIRRSIPVIDSIIGNLGDIRVKRNLKDALAELNGFQKERDDYSKFMTMSDSLSRVKLTNEDLYKPNGDYSVVDTTGAISNTDAYKEYSRIIDENNTKVNEGDTSLSMLEATPDSFKQFITSNPQYYKELTDKGHINLDKTPIAPEELDKIYFEKAGIKDPNDVQFYTEYSKNKFNPNNYNERLLKFIYGKEDDLTSQGTLADTQYKKLLQFAGLLNISPQTTSNEDPLKKLSPDKWKVGNYNGVPYWYADVYDDKTRQWTKQYIQPLTEEEAKKNKVNQKKKLSDFTVDEFKNTSYDDLIKNYSASDLYDNFNQLPKEIQDKLYEAFPDWKAEDMTGLKKGKSGRKSKGLGGLKFNTAYDADLKVLSDIGLKYKQTNTPYGDWEEKDKEKYEEHSNKILALNPDWSIEDVWSKVGDFEARKYKKQKQSKIELDSEDGSINPKTGLTPAQEWEEVQNIYKNLATAVSSGKMKQADAISTFSKWYKDNKGLLSPEVIKQIEEYIDQYL